MSGKIALIKVGFAIFAPSFATATPLYWDNNGTTAGTTATPAGTWGTSNFWNTDPEGGAGTFSTITTADDDVIFSAGTTATGTYNVTVSGSRVAKSITVEDGLTNFAGNATPSLTIDTGGILVKDLGRLGGASTLPSWLLAGSQTWTVDSNGTDPVFYPSASTTLAGATDTGNITLTLAGNNSIIDSVAYRGFISDGIGNTLSIVKDGSGTWNLTRGSTYTGGFTLNNGMIDYPVSSSGVANAPTAGVFGTGIITINGGEMRARMGHRTILNRIVLGGDFSIIGPNQSTLAGSMDLGAGNRKITCTLSDPAANHVISGAISNGGLIKAGPNPLSLTGTSTYAGATTVSEGTLTVSGSGSINSSSGISVFGSNAKLLLTSSVSSTPPITLAEGTVDATGTVGAVNVGDSLSNVLANGNGGFGSLTTGDLNFGGEATVNVNISQTSAAIAAGVLTSSGDNGAVAINVRRSGAWNNGPNNLISFTSFPSADVNDFVLGDVTGPVLGPRQQLGGLVLNGNHLALEIIGDPIRWTGQATNQWTVSAVGGDKNWKLTSDNAAVDYLEGDDVVFDDTPGTDRLVQIDDANVNPATTTFNNSSAVNYTLASANGFGIAAGTLTKNGNGSVTLTTGNFHGGGTMLNHGLLNLNHPLALGSGPLTVNGGVIGNTSGTPVVVTSTIPQNWNGDIVFAGPNDLDLGKGAVTVGGVDTDRSITVNSGTFTVGELRASAHDVTKLGVGTLVLSSVGGAASGSVIVGKLNVAAGALQIGRTGVAGGDLTVSGLSGTGTIANGALEERLLRVDTATDASFDGTLTDGPRGPLGLHKQGPATLTLTGSNSYTGITTVVEGTLSITQPVLADTASVVIGTTGAVLHLAHSSTDQVGSLTINGESPKANGVYDATTDPGFITGTGKIRVGPPASGYSSWVNGFPFTAGVNDGPGQDADGDGIENLLEYVLGGIPVGAGSADTSILPVQSLTNDHLILTFRRSDLSENDAVVKVQWSTNLGVWNDFVTVGAEDALPAVSVTEDSPSAALDTVVVRIPQTLAAGTKLFGRVVATKP